MHDLHVRLQHACMYNIMCVFSIRLRYWIQLRVLSGLGSDPVAEYSASREYSHTNKLPKLKFVAVGVFLYSLPNRKRFEVARYQESCSRLSFLICKNASVP